MDTIVALSSPPGIGAIAAVRLSGPEAFSIGSKIAGIDLENIKQRYAYYRILRREDGLEIDDGIVLFYGAPHSYTGEDTVEFFCHSSPAVLNLLLDECIRLGARPAEPGEFTKRAFLNGKMDLVQVEAVADIIEAVSPASLEAALNLRKGLLSETVRRIRERLLFLLSEFEAEIDFEEEELLEMSAYEERKAIILQVASDIKELIKNGSEGVKVREGIRVALIGVPNVGKSSLMNALARRERAIVTPEPGTTRDVIEEKINLKGVTVILTDTAGIREAKSIAEEEGVRRSRQAIEEADIILFVLDGSREISREEYGLLKDIPVERTIFVVNKSDLEVKISREDVLNFIEKSGFGRNEESEIIYTSAERGYGLEELSQAIVKRVFKKGVPPRECLLVTNRRHLYHLKNSEKILDEAIKSLEDGNIELTAFLLREATMELSKIIGLVTHDEIMTEIFSRFCIGK